MDKFLLYEDIFKGRTSKGIPSSHTCISFISDHISTKQNYQQFDDKYWDFTVFDLLMNESRQIQFFKSGNKFYYTNISPLNDDFVFIVECSNEIRRINLTKIDWDTNELKLIEHSEKECIHFWIFNNKSDSSKFVLKWMQDYSTVYYQICKLINGKVKFGEVFQSRFNFTHYFDDKLIRDYKLSESEITIHDLILDKTQVLKIDCSSLSNSTHLGKFCGWHNNQMYIYVKFDTTQNYSIAWADLIGKRWTLLKLKLNLEIQLDGDLKEKDFMEDQNVEWNLNSLDGNLIVSTRQSRQQNDKQYESKVKIYSIPVKKPNSLRYLAWIRVVKVMKQRGEKDPYNAAKEFLPLNSDLRPIWFKNEEPKKSLKRKLDIRGAKK